MSRVCAKLMIPTAIAAVALSCSTTDPAENLPHFQPDPELATVALVAELWGDALVVHRPGQWPGGLILLQSDVEPNVLAGAVRNYIRKRNRFERGEEENDSTMLRMVVGSPPDMEWATEVLRILHDQPEYELEGYGPARVASVRLSCAGDGPDPLESGPCRVPRRPNR